mmetsp:Transcript_28855/g.54555  ORF Transcript_28855/g.54555 Transcript_28855/m.54555 type:complete len:95 (-) Transcript_28855:80-364(-)
MSQGKTMYYFALSPINCLFATVPPPNKIMAPKGHTTARVKIFSALFDSSVMAPPLAFRMWNTLEKEHWIARRWRIVFAADDTAILVALNDMTFK